MPNSLNASTSAFITAGSEPAQPASPQPLAPSRLVRAGTGWLVTGSYMDYAMPRADNAPMFEFGSHPVPATTNPLGVKGCGEAGCAGALPAVMNAVVDALKPFGVRHIDMPATPELIWRAIKGGRK